MKNIATGDVGPNLASAPVQDQDLNPVTASLPRASLPETLAPPAEIFSLRDLGNCTPRARNKENVNDPKNSPSIAMRSRKSFLGACCLF